MDRLIINLRTFYRLPTVYILPVVHEVAYQVENISRAELCKDMWSLPLRSGRDDANWVRQAGLPMYYSAPPLLGGAEHVMAYSIVTSLIWEPAR